MQSKQEIKIKGIKYPLHGGMSTLRLYCKDMGYKSITEGFSVFASEGNDLTIEMMDGMAAFILAGIKEGSRKKGMEKPEITMEDVIDLFDDDINMITEAMGYLTDNISEIYDKQNAEKGGDKDGGKKQKA